MPRGKTTNKKCEICSKEVSLFAYNRHINACDKKSKRIMWQPTNCIYCNKNYNIKIAYSNHIRRCPLNPDRILNPITESGKIRKYELAIGNKWSDERRKAHCLTMKQAVLDNPESYTTNNVCGRVKIEDYKGERFHGKWELLVAKWFDVANIKWERKMTPFNYFWNNKWHLYFPDFYLPEIDMFVEVKGFKRDRDVCKWAVVPNLIVIQSKEIQDIQKGIFKLTVPQA